MGRWVAVVVLPMALGACTGQSVLGEVRHDATVAEVPTATDLPAVDDLPDDLPPGDVACGRFAEPPCPPGDDRGCQDGVVRNGRCACAEGRVFDTVTGFCLFCGAAGQPCCEAGRCAGFQRCTAGVCDGFDCPATFQCGTRCCGAGTRCSDAGTCVPPAAGCYECVADGGACQSYNCRNDDPSGGFDCLHGDGGTFRCSGSEGCRDFPQCPSAQ